MPMNYFEKLKRLVNERINPSRDKSYDIYEVVRKGVDDGELWRFGYDDVYLLVQDQMPEARFDEVVQVVNMMDFTGQLKWIGHTKRGASYIPMFQVNKDVPCP